MHTRKLLCVLLITAVTCVEVSAMYGEPATTHQDTTLYEEVKAIVENVNAEINMLVKGGLYDEAGKYFAEDVIQLISGQPPITSRLAWIETQKQAAQLGAWDLQLETLELEVRGDIAVERGRGVQTFSANAGSPIASFTAVGDYIVLWKKSDDGWKIHWDYVVLQQPGNK